MTLDFSIPPITDELPIELRCYATPRWEVLPEETGEPKKSERRATIGASPWTLIFDTETTTDACQALRFGTYQLRKAGELVDAGIFYDPEGTTPNELEALSAYAAENGQNLRTRDSFADDVFFAKAYQYGTMIVGFNLPFDISRLAISHATARTPKAGHANAMHGGFTFKLSRQKIWPNVRVKHMSSRSALISFAAPMGQRDSRGERKRGFKRGVRRGHFLDVKTLAAALFAKSFSLSGLAEFLQVPNRKLEFSQFDGPISSDMIEYAVRDTQTTWECYEALMARFNDLKLVQTRPEKIYSEVGIGKAYLKEMGIATWRTMQPDIPSDVIARIMGTYFGGRSEVRIRRQIRQVILCDFLSMYPTVCTLMGLWRFVIAKGMTWHDTTAETTKLLAGANVQTLQNKEAWRSLTTLVRVRTAGDIVPVRANYPGSQESTIGLNHLSGDTPLWFTLADCINSKILSGRMPDVVEAISFEPGPVQDDLLPFDIAGQAAYRVDPVADDLFKRTIELRQTVKAHMKDASDSERDRLDIEQHSLKILANSTSYGIWVETNVETRSERRALSIISSTTNPFSFDSDKSELPGKYFHPLLATLITGAARLMLGLAETLAAERGLDWCFCDTDSMAFAKPNTMRQDDFARNVGEVVEWFAALNPYDFSGSILKIEDVNNSLNGDTPEPLYCFAISSKRYALFNIGDDGAPIMRKVSAHGFGASVAALW